MLCPIHQAARPRPVVPGKLDLDLRLVASIDERDTAARQLRGCLRIRRAARRTLGAWGRLSWGCDHTTIALGGSRCGTIGRRVRIANDGARSRPIRGSAPGRSGFGGRAREPATVGGLLGPPTAREAGRGQAQDTDQPEREIAVHARALLPRLFGWVAARRAFMRARARKLVRLVHAERRAKLLGQ